MMSDKYLNSDWPNYSKDVLENDKVPFAVYESLGDRLNIANKRLFILSIVLTVLLVFTNLGWLYYESQYQVEETTMIEAEQDGDVNIVGGKNVNYGPESQSDNNKEKNP